MGAEPINHNSTGVLLKKALRRVQQQNPKFSVRALATKLGVSAPFLSKVFNDKASLPVHHFDSITQFLQMDELCQAQLKASIVADKVGADWPKDHGNLQIFKNREPMPDTIEYPKKTYKIIEKWYNLAILDLLTCSGADRSVMGIAAKLNLREQDVQSSLDLLIELGFVTKLSTGQFKKVDRHVRLPAPQPGDLIKSYYQQILKRAMEELNKQTPSAASRRLFTNVSVAVNPANIPRAKERLHEALYEVVNILTEGKCSEVYSLTGILFPVTKTDDKKE